MWDNVWMSTNCVVTYVVTLKKWKLGKICVKFMPNVYNLRGSMIFYLEIKVRYMLPHH